MDCAKKKKHSFNEKDFHEELEKLGKASLMQYQYNRGRRGPVPPPYLPKNVFIGTSKKYNAVGLIEIDVNELSKNRKIT